MRFITTKIHGILDFTLAAVLILLPFLLGYGKVSTEAGILILSGGVIIAYSLMTTYECGILGLISMRTHLILDFLIGIFLLASPWIFRFNGHVYTPYLVLGSLEILIPIFTGPSINMTHSGSGAHPNSKDLFADVFKPQRLSQRKQKIAEQPK